MSSSHDSRPPALLTTTPLPASRKVYVEGALPGVLVPMREITLTPTQAANGGPTTPNASVTVYDCSGPYTDPNAKIDIRAGLTPLRRAWILDRDDVDELPHVSSEYGRLRAVDPKLADLRFRHLRKPLRAKPHMNVTQMHYARKGMVTPEMEYIAIRENQSLERILEPASSLDSHGGGVAQHPGQAWGMHGPALSHAERVCNWTPAASSPPSCGRVRASPRPSHHLARGCG